MSSIISEVPSTMMRADSPASSEPGFRLIILTGDAVLIVAALIVITLARGGSFDAPDIVLALMVFSLKYAVGLALVTGFRAGFKPILVNWILIVSILLGLGYVTDYANVFDPMALATWIVSVPLILYAARRVAMFPSRRVDAKGCRKAVIVGATERGRKLAENFVANDMHRVKVAGFFDSRDVSRLDNAAATPVIGGLAALPVFVKANDVHSVYIALPMSSQPRILKLLDDLRDTTASIYFVPLITDMIHARVANISGIPVLAVRETPFLGMNALVKRVEDLVLAGLILMLTSPLLLFIAVGVKLSSPGPVIFRQRRYGLDGKEIMVYKFRTMQVTEDCDTQYHAVSRNDQRVTRFGAWLRKASLDELPQFFNVLQGSMSVIGPRPHVTVVSEQYRRIIPGYMIRHKIKPGLTGWAQIHGYRGGNDVEQMKKRIEFDLQYLSNWSLGLDMAILFRTLPIVVFGDRNAY
jgi:putative colanic acid biosynthesis UDP-glucose lipid carrier transferase